MTERNGYLRSREGVVGNYSQSIDALFAHLDQSGQPGLNIALVRHGELVHQRGYGVANVEDDVPIRPNTLFRLGSITKHLCATGILILENRRRLSLDDYIHQYVPEIPPVACALTLRHLLTMTSGLQDGITLPIFAGLGSIVPLTQAQHLDLVRRCDALMFAPGEQVVYCNSNYALLSLVIERLSDMPLAEFLKREIFSPLGMTSTRLVADPLEIVTERARGYIPHKTAALKAGVFLLEMCGDGGVDSTLEDMIRWLCNYRNDRHFGPDYRARMEGGGRLNDGTPISYRLGINVSEYRGLTKVSHSGGMPGYLADFCFYPQLDAGVILLANWMQPKLLDAADSIVDVLLEQDGTASVPTAAVSSVTAAPPGEGLYICHETGFALQIEREAGAIACYMMGERSMLRALSDTRLEPTKRGMQYVIEYDRGVLGPDVLLVRFGAAAPLPFWINPAQMPVCSNLGDFVGLYYCEMLGEFHRIFMRGDVLEVTLGSGLRQLSWSELAYRTKDVFTARVRGEPTESNLTLRFFRDSDGRITAFGYSVFRCRGVRFDRCDDGRVSNAHRPSCPL